MEARRGRGEDAAGAPSAKLTQALQEILSGRFSPEEPDRYRDLVEGVLHHDYFMVAADFEAYAAKQAEVSARWADQRGWWRSAIHNVAQVGWFSSDRAVREYADEIWRVPLRQ